MESTVLPSSTPEQRTPAMSTPINQDAATPVPVTAAGDADGTAPAEQHWSQGAARERKFDPLEAIKLGSQRLASIIKLEAHLHAPDAPSSSGGAADSGTEQVVARLRATAADLGARAKEQGSRFYAASLKTAENIKRLTLGEPLQALCRSEAAARPCPQLALAVCTALVSGGGLSTQRLFKHNPPQELVDRLAESFSGPPALLPPAANPHALAGLLKQWLCGLQEPLLTFRLLPSWVAAGESPELCRTLVQQLPAANANTLRLLIETCAHVNAQAAANEMDAQALAETLAPCVAWKPRLAEADALHRVTPLDDTEHEAVARVLEWLILNTAAAFAAPAASVPAV